MGAPRRVSSLTWSDISSLMEALGVVLEEEGGEAEGITLAHLAMVGHVGLEGEGGDAVGGAMAGVETDPAEELVGGEVEHHHVEAHVHVAVVIDPFRAHAVAVAVEGGGNVGRHASHHMGRGCQPRKPQTSEPRARSERHPATHPVATSPPATHT